MHRYAAKAVILGLVLGAAGLATSPAPAPAQAQAPAPMKVTLTVGGRTETLRGPGRCGKEPGAWLHGAAAALWTAEYTGEGDGPWVSLSYWRLAAGETSQFSLTIEGETAVHRISTVEGGTLEGSGRVTFQPTALGGRFEIAGRAQDGARLEVSIECARFGAIAAEGG